jgi:EAL domain-containing protein (putative c-di-GMP-specific phosphodiesterase class I)
MQSVAWQEAGLRPIIMSVNVSARQFRDRHWLERVRSTLRECGLQPEHLELELTESMIMHDVAEAAVTMRQLRAMGVRLAIDDFGTGHSSLSALKSFPIQRLKIDRAFVRDITIDEQDRAIVMAVIELAHRLGLEVIAEGVETDGQLQFLRGNGCDQMQGYLFSRPALAESIPALLAV